MTDANRGSLPRSCCPSVWLWPGHALFAGPSLNLRPHSGSVWCLIVGVDTNVTVSLDDSQVVARSVLVPPRRVHHLETHGGRLVSCYLDPSSSRARSCESRCRNSADGLAVDHIEQDRLAALPENSHHARRWMARAAPVSGSSIDPRIARVIAQIRADPAQALPAAQLAEGVGLSESRLLHLFRDETATSMRRYRLWSRLMAASESVSSGQTLTEAAAGAGFSSPSHLADRFRTTFGLSASALIDRGTRLRVMWD